LAHEFSHMIYFHQKVIEEDLESAGETWLNEMCAMMAEDFLQTKLETEGRRGVSYLDGSAGGTDNDNTWFNLYNRFNYVPVSHWFGGNVGKGQETSVYNSYAINTAFGAYLGRNFGGAELFKNIVQNPFTDSAAIDFALAQGIYSDETYSSVLKKWAVAGLLSYDTAAPEDYRYNTGGFMTSTVGPIDYDLGSINLFNYETQPTIYTSLPAADAMAGRYKTSNMIYKVGSNLTGVIEKEVTLRKNSKLTLLLK
jgi:hypothetical protein